MLNLAKAGSLGQFQGSNAGQNEPKNRWQLWQEEVIEATGWGNKVAGLNK